MYHKYFNLSEVPFKIVPDPRFLWYSEQHQEAKEKIEYHINEKDGPVYLSAQVGLGKTSIASRIRDVLMTDKSKRVVYAFAPNLKTANQFMRFISEEFGVQTGRSYATTLRNFQEFLLDQVENGITTVLLIDEAQNLSRDTLKTIHHLFNFATYDAFLLQVALFGQPELHKRIKRFESLASRMYMAKLSPFNLEQTISMMQFRWTVAGGDKLPFDDEALEELFRLTGGIARNICKLANDALIRAVVEDSSTVTKGIVANAASEAFEEA